MRTITIIFILCFFIQNVNGQTKTILAYNMLKEKNLTDAKSTIEEAIIDTSENKNPDTWFVRAEIYFAINNSENKTDKLLCSNPIDEALSSYLKTMELDKDKKHLTNTINRLKLLSIMYFNIGVDEFNKKAYSSAVGSFENSVKINNMPSIMKIDTMLFFNIAKTAEKAMLYDKAIQYYLRLVELNYEGARTYENLANIYQQKGDIDNFLKTATDGVRNFPNDNAKLLKMLINYYLGKNMFDDAQKYLEIAITKETTYSPYYYILGNISERKDLLDKAEEYYKLAVKYQSDYFEPNYNLGVIFYNKAAKQIEVVNALTSKSEYEIEKPKIDEYFKTALGYYESAYKVKPDETETLKSLEFLYTRFNITDKLKIIQQKLGK